MCTPKALLEAGHALTLAQTLAIYCIGGLTCHPHGGGGGHVECDCYPCILTTLVDNAPNACGTAKSNHSTACWRGM